MSTDTLSDVLRAVRLKGAVFFDVEASGPWVAESPPAQSIAPGIMPGTDHVIEFHIVTSGFCFGSLLDGEPVRLEAGDVIVFPQGDPHVMSSAPGMRQPPDMAAHQRPVGTQLPIALRLGSGEAAATHVICGFLGCDARPFNPLLSALPRVFCVRGASMEQRTLDPFMRLALGESKARRPGSETILARLSELLFVEAVRTYVSELPPEQRGWLAGLRDDVVGRALMRIHDHPAYDWSLDELAKEVGISRSVLAERFTQYVGVPPMQYLAQWRMQLAASMLTSTTASLAEIAAQIGYGSEAALSRAFKRIVGVAPALYRQGKRADAASTA